MSEAGAVAARKSESVFVGSLFGNTEVEVGSEPSGSGVLLLTSSQSGSNGSFSVSSHPCIDFLSLGFGSSEGISSTLFRLSSISFNASDVVLSTLLTVGLPLKSSLLSCISVSLDTSLNFLITCLDSGLILFSLFNGSLSLSFLTLYISGSASFTFGIPISSGPLSSSHSGLPGSEIFSSLIFISDHGSFSISLDACIVFITSSTMLFFSKYAGSSIGTERQR